MLTYGIVGGISYVPTPESQGGSVYTNINDMELVRTEKLANLEAKVRKLEEQLQTTLKKMDTTRGKIVAEVCSIVIDALREFYPGDEVNVTRYEARSTAPVVEKLYYRNLKRTWGRDGTHFDDYVVEFNEAHPDGSENPDLKREIAITDIIKMERVLE